MLFAYNAKDSGQAGTLPAAPSARAPAFGARTSQGVTESVEVAGASEMVVAESPAGGTQMARNDAPAIEKAKPALQTETSQLQNSVSAAVPELPLQGRNVVTMAKSAPLPSPTRALVVTWTITAGALQRSLDNGRSWQSAVHADHPLLCYASHGADVWTGGQAGTLLHSIDNGVTWLPVRPSSKGQALTSDVTRIVIRDSVRDNLRSPAEIVVSTDNNEAWSSADGGKIWEKQQ